MREYLLGVICAAFLCSVVNAIGGEGRGTRKLVSGVFLALSLLHPLGSLELHDFPLDPILREAEDAAQNGTAQASAARNEIITDSLEAYILTEAEALGLTFEVHVALAPDCTPVSVTLSGPVSPSEREVLSSRLIKTLGIGKEDLHWTSYPQGNE